MRSSGAAQQQCVAERKPHFCQRLADGFAVAPNTDDGESITMVKVQFFEGFA